MDKVSINEFNTLYSSFIKNKKFSTHKKLLSLISDLCKQKAKISIFEKQNICLSCNIFIENDEKYPIHCDCNIHIKCFDNYIKKKTSKKSETSKEFKIVCEICEKNIILSNLNLTKTKYIKKEANEMCLICLSKYNINEEYIMQQCQNQLKIDLKCPISECIENISLEKCKFFLSNSQFEIIENKILIQNIDSYKDLDEKIARCPNSECNYFLILSIEDETKSVFCPQCKEEYCVNGCANLHNNMTCSEYEKIFSQEDNNFKNYIKKKKVKLCGKCKKWVEKSKGCNHIVCLCKYEFCYLCGEKWKNCDCNQFTHDSEEEESVSSNQRLGLFRGARRRIILVESDSDLIKPMSSESDEDSSNSNMYHTFGQHEINDSDIKSNKTKINVKNNSIFNVEESKSSENKISIDYFELKKSIIINDKVSSTKTIRYKKLKKKNTLIFHDSFSNNSQSSFSKNILFNHLDSLDNLSTKNNKTIENNFHSPFLNDSLEFYQKNKKNDIYI